MFLILINLSALFLNCGAVKVFRNVLNLTDPSPVGGASLRGASVEMVDITMCIRFNFQMLGFYEGKSRLITIEDWREDVEEPSFKMLWFGANYPTSFFGIGYPEMTSYLLQDPGSQRYEIWIPNKWTHVCLSYEKANSYLRMVKDGVTLNINFEDTNLKNFTIPSDFLNKTHIGRCSFDFQGGCSNPAGLLSDFNIWNKALSEKDAQDWTTCRSFAKGNVVNWEESEFELENMVEDEIKMEQLCKPLRPGHVFFPDKRNMTSALDICRKMRARISVVASRQTQDLLIEVYRESPYTIWTGPGFWGGWWDLYNEGTFENINTREPLEPDAFQPWYFGEPNGNTIENCQTVWPYRDAWNDLSCDDRTEFFCEFEQSPYLQMRELLTDPSVYATTNTTEYPLGTFLWDFHGDKCNGIFTEHSKVSINFNACNGSEFNCLDGSCVGIGSRCDGRIDCEDKSDEFDCEMIIIDKSYIKDIPAPPQGDLTLTPINASVEILSILSIDEVDSYITLQFQLNLEWIDSRLTFQNLKEDSFLNTLNSMDKKKIWIPEVLFFNTEEKEESINDEKSYITVARLGHFQESSYELLQNTHIYKGSENVLKISRVYTVKFLCEFDMNIYPFDSQQCQMQFIMKGNSGNFARLRKSVLSYTGKIDLTQYFIKGWQIYESEMAPNLDSVIVEIALGRRILSEIMTTYLPTTLICIVAFSTNYFKAFFFEAVVTVNLTSLLVLTTLFISVSNSLPKTAYIKMIDLWLLFCLLIPFLEVIIHTFIDSLRLEDDREVNHHGKATPIDGDNMEPKKLFTKPDLNVNSRANPMPIIMEVSQSKRSKNLIARDEQSEINARMSFYNNLVGDDEKILKICVQLARKGLPTIFVLFAVVYFAIGFIKRSNTTFETIEN
ncbi:hypothetical protein TCAL_02367 [Tigriopus californicus]|uniref:C-type lectin domain-containing protein n=1 Tax=Tigriopus californicus TaxID=6832 RepID=A0A553NYI7_TIGCA|nr:hypothetical protein TCAL_02367 [Tigriopus californicus]